MELHCANSSENNYALKITFIVINNIYIYICLLTNVQVIEPCSCNSSINCMTYISHILH